MDANPTPPRTRYCGRCLTTFTGEAERCPNLACHAARPAQGWSELLDPGALIDRTYRVKERLAIGGAGVTYLAQELGPDDQETGPPLAIKMLYQQRDSGPYLRRLQTEAQILQGLNHPQIVECRGFVHRAGHSPYLVTRYMGGGSLLDHLRRHGPLPPVVVAGIGRQICWALDVAHRQGVIHRDLKPENVLLEAVVARGVIPEVRVADFGIAKVFGGVGDRLTRVGAFVGTPQYAAPEQFDGLAPEPATDVYALGAVLLFCLTLRPVAEHMADLDHEDQRDHLVRHLPPKLPELPEPDRGKFEAVLAMAMAVDAGDRCDLAQLEAALAGFGADGAHARLEAQAPGPMVSRTLTLPPKRTKEAGKDPPKDAAREAEAPRVPTPPPLPPRSTPSATTPTISRTGSTRRGSGVVIGGALFAAVGGALLLLAAAGGWWWWSTEGSRVEISPDAADPKARAAFSSLGLTLAREGVRAERNCKTPKYLALSLDLDARGVIEDLRLTNYADARGESCIESELRRYSYPHDLGAPARISLQLRD